MLSYTSAQAANAQDFSGKPIRLLVGLAAGGATDVMARLVAQKMSENLRTTVFVENKVGGNFIPALRELTGSPADGHTLFFISTSTLITQPLHPDYPYDLTQLTPVTQVATGPLILVVKNSLGIKTMGELINHAKMNPGKLSFGAGGGTGSSLYFATELLKAKTGIKITIVNYRGAGTGAQRSPRRAHRRHVRCHAGHGRAGQGRQGHAARGHQRHALAGIAQCADHPGVGRAGLRDGRMVWHPCARRHPARHCPTPARRGGKGRGRP
jgi:hypothetical protein